MTLNKRLNLIVCVFLLFAGLALCSATNVLPVNYRLLQDDDEKQREEIEKAAKKLRKQAEDRYEDGAYWQAAVDLILILDFYPAYSQKEDAIFLLARSLYEMQMYEGVDALYRHLLKSVKRPRLVAESILGLQKVAFQKKDYQQSLKFYHVLESHYTQHDGIHEARYFAEQTYFNLQNYNIVHNIAAHINKKSAFYPFARYTSGLAHVKKKV